MYQPKLNLKFNPPIPNNEIGIGQLDDILETIGMVYPEARWWYGGKPTDFNPFIDIEDQDDLIIDEVCSLSIGYREEWSNRLTYGMYCEDDIWGSVEIDGWEWFEKHKFDADETSAMFEPLTESIKRDWTVDDLKTLYDNKILLYEVGYDGEPITHDDIIGDGVGDILYIDKWTDDNRYTICYKIKVDGYENGVQECLASSESTIVKWLNNGSLQPVYNFMNTDVEDMFEPLNESQSNQTTRFRIGDKVIVNGRYYGAAPSGGSVIINFDDDYGTIMDIIPSPVYPNGPWYLIKFEFKKISGFSDDSIYLLNGLTENYGLSSNITIEYPEEYEWDDLFG